MHASDGSGTFGGRGRRRNNTSGKLVGVGRIYGCEHLRMRKALTAVLHWLIRYVQLLDGLACDIQEAAVVSNTESVTW